MSCKFDLDAESNIPRTCCVTTWREARGRLWTPSETPGESESCSPFTISASGSLQSEILIIWNIWDIWNIWNICNICNNHNIGQRLFAKWDFDLLKYLKYLRYWSTSFYNVMSWWWYLFNIHHDSHLKIDQRHKWERDVFQNEVFLVDVKMKLSPLGMCWSQSQGTVSELSEMMLLISLMMMTNHGDESNDDWWWNLYHQVRAGPEPGHSVGAVVKTEILGQTDGEGERLLSQDARMGLGRSGQMIWSDFDLRLMIRAWSGSYFTFIYNLHFHFLLKNCWQFKNTSSFIIRF